jgi:hypothetical protein
LESTFSRKIPLMVERLSGKYPYKQSFIIFLMLGQEIFQDAMAMSKQSILKQ